MKIEVDQALSVSISEPSAIPAGSTIHWRLKKETGMSPATTRVDLFSTTGTPLAYSTDVTDNDTEITGTMQTTYLPIAQLFTAKRADARIPVIMVVSDANRLWAASSVEIVNRMGMEGSDPEDPQKYVSIDQLKEIGLLDPHSTGYEIIDKINQILGLGE